MSTVLRIPYGTRDILPGEARAKREIEDKIANNFLSWGYDEAITPTFEYADTFALSGAGISEESMRFMDRSNRTLMLRSEMTTPLARMVATRLKNDKGVKRLFYIANVFRHEQTQAGRQCEFSQAGIELIGAEAPMADAEVLALAVESLKAAGLQDFLISIGHSGFLAGLMEDAKLTKKQADFVKSMILSHNAVGLEEAAERFIPKPLKDMFRDLLYLQGGRDLLDSLEARVTNPKSLDALKNLKAIYKLAESYGVAPYLSFDLSLIRNFDYYTGMVFEAYAPQIGFNICGGGRYDHMMEAFGDPEPATGFAMGIDRIILSLRRDGRLNMDSKWDIYVAWAPGCQSKAIQKAMELRQGGKNVKVGTNAMTPEEAAKACAANRCEAVAYVG
ncbi:ATP phosphoribosyltransferase regulatory subunit [Acidaminococcus timonensis]|uniref:ATP phosphoribosyltransferase regulatory subunit n=1 Tax=Acidaminococcus timonensis TaxID=1871002 RepID=UPI0025EF7BF5|nr:ATP phosphoribosyltransferase regulatory subunit [Acidaminococcus timonensis]